MTIQAGDTAMAWRQSCASQFTGVNPQNAEPVTFKARVDADTGIIEYANPSDPAETALAQGGLFDFGREQTVRILGYRAHSGLGDITVTIGDRDNALHDVVIGSAAGVEHRFNTPVPVLASQVVKISSASGNAAGFIDLYVVKGSWF